MVADPPVIDVPPAELDDLRDRLRRTRWSPMWPTPGWAAGTDPTELERLSDFWASGFDWYAQQRAINELPWATAEFDEIPLRYLRFDAETRGALPLVLTNGWPSTALELVELARRLATPSQYGGDAADAFTVIVPALPGFPFSPQRRGHDEQTHDLWHRLMHGELGFERYAAHGGDLGAGISSRLAQAHPEAVVGIHLLAVAAPAQLDAATLTEAEREHVDGVHAWVAAEGAYMHQQQTRPLSLAPALADSLRSGLTTRVNSVDVPTAVALFPHDLAQSPRSWAERTYNVVRYTQMPHGGHFAPHEEPELVATDLRDFLRPLR